MLTLYYTRAFTIAAAAVVCVLMPSSSSGETITFSISSAATAPAPYVGYHASSGHLDFTFSDNQDFAVQIDKVSLDGPYCSPGTDCQTGVDNRNQGDHLGNVALDTGTTCGVGAFLKPNGKPCTIEVGFDLLDDRRPDPNTDYGLWTIFAHLDVHQAGNPDNLGIGTSLGQVYVLDPGATVPTPEPASAILALAGAMAIVLPKRLTPAARRP